MCLILKCNKSFIDLQNKNKSFLLDNSVLLANLKLNPFCIDLD